jgi:transposase
LNKLESVRTLRRVLDEHFKTEGKGRNRKIKFKDRKELAPSGERIVSPHEPDARVASKGEKTVIGFKTHTSETCTPGFPNLITHVQTEPATVNDSLSLESIVRSMSKRKHLPKRLWLDGGYVNAEVFAKLKKSLGIDFVARLTNGHSWQSKEGKGFDLQNFSINWRKQTASCPANAESVSWKSDGTGGANVYFAPSDCGPCPFKENCAKGKFRVLHLKAKSVHRYMTKMRTRQNTDEFNKEYAIRAGVEGLQSRLINRHGRRANVRTRRKVSLKLIWAATILNISRLIDWTNGRQKGPTRKGKYELAFTAA